jgi:precorrin-3B C17-methyltransferase/precorrin-6y C5,15-methyltransferase (decarboxylating) CbiE subunit/precorrin-6Y C5,15-methyltransferase (decarboxylating) CbiT subunit
VVGLLGGRPVGAEAEAAIRHATLVAGGREQLAGVADLVAPGARTVVVGAGLHALDEIAASAEPACVLASGDPGFFGILRPLAERSGAERLVVHPAPSSLALAFGRLGLPWDRAVVRSCHTGGAARAAAEVARAPVAAVLCGPDAPPESVGAALVALGAGHPTVAVATRLGEPGEKVVRCAGVAGLAAGRFDHRSVVVLAGPEAAPVAPTARRGGRPVADFAHRASMITKPEVRSVVLGKLDLPERGVLWDIGAGSGSVAIEAALAAPGLRVIAVERGADDVARVLSNAAVLGALVEVVQGSAPEVLVDLPAPDRVFVGGGGLDVLGAATAALRPGGRIVATFAAIDRAAQAHRLLGSLVQVGVDRAEVLPDGGIRFAADNPVFVAWGDRPGGDAPPLGERIAVGVGCSSMATADEVAALVSATLTAAGIPPSPVPSEEPGGRWRPAGSSEELGGSFPGGGVTQRSQEAGSGLPAPQRGEADESLTSPEVVIATIDRRRDHPAVTGAAGTRSIVTFPAALLGTVDVPDPSDLVDAAVGTPSVAEAAALLAAGPGARLVVGKQRNASATAAIAVGPRRHQPGRVRIVGLGPGDPRHRTPAAAVAVRAADAVLGYGPYVDAAGPLLRPEQLVIRSTMGAEAERAHSALALAAAGWDVALVSSGDPGVFAMASVTLELAATAAHHVDVEVVPGLTASSAAAAAAGAPLAGPHATLTLSDLLLPWPVIEAQLRAAAGARMALALYNPRSAGRPDHLSRAQDILLEVLPPATPVAIVTAAGTAEERVDRATLGTLDPSQAGMRSLVLIGTADTVDEHGRLVTRRHHPRPEVPA